MYARSLLFFFNLFRIAIFNSINICYRAFATVEFDFFCLWIAVSFHLSVISRDVSLRDMQRIFVMQLPYSYPLPAIKIGKLAVDKTMQGRGLGKTLLMKCLKKAVRLSSEVGTLPSRLMLLMRMLRLFI